MLENIDIGLVTAALKLLNTALVFLRQEIAARRERKAKDEVTRTPRT